MTLRRILASVAVLVGLGVAAAPLVVALLLNLQDLRFAGDVGRGSAIIIILVLVYVVWLPGTVYGLIWVLDLLGVHYAVRDRVRIRGLKERQRRGAGLRYLSRRPTFGQGPARGQGQRARSEDRRSVRPRGRTGRKPSAGPDDRE